MDLIWNGFVRNGTEDALWNTWNMVAINGKHKCIRIIKLKKNEAEWIKKD